MPSRSIVRSILIIGSASFLSILFGIIRVKVLAVLLGPAGIGVLGIFTNIQTTASQLAGMGLGTSGVRQLAASSDDPAVLSRVRKALLAANLALGAAGMLVVWLLRERLAYWIFEDPSRAGDIGLLGVGVLLSLIAGSQTALLQGLRRIGDLARVTVLSALVATVGGIGVVWTLGFDGIVWFVVAAPAANVLVALWFTARLPRPAASRMSVADLVAQWRAMFSLGVTFMLGGVLLALGLLIVSALIARELGLEAAGHFQASWAISAQYVGLILGAMGADYFPRLSGMIEDRERSNELVNTQAQISLLLAGPALLGMLALAPWVIELLYSAEFRPAVELLRWQTLGNILKILSWSVGFILIARARGRLFFLTELLSNTLYLLMVWVAIPIVGLSGAGIAFFASYAFYILLVTTVASRVHGFRWQRETIVLAVILLGAGGAVHVLSYASALGAAYIGVALALGMGVVNLRAIVRKTGTQGRLGSKVARVYRLVGWPVE